VTCVLFVLCKANVYYKDKDKDRDRDRDKLNCAKRILNAEFSNKSSNSWNYSDLERLNTYMMCS